MDLLTSLLVCLMTLIGIVLLVVRQLLKPIIPVEGETNIPGPIEGRRWPIVGDALWFWGVENTTEIYGTIKRLCSMREKLLSFYLGPKLVIFVMDAKILEAIISINKCQAKEVEFYRTFNALTNGLFSKNGKGWSNLRRPLDRLIHPKHMVRFHGVFTDKANTLCAKVGDKLGKGEFDVKDLVAYCMLDIIVETLLNVPGTQQIDNTWNIPEVVKKVVDIVFRKLSKLEYKIDWIYNLTSLGKMEPVLKAAVRPVLRQMTIDCSNHMENSGRDPTDTNFVPENFIEVAIQAGLSEKKSEEEIIFSFVDLIVAGYDTSSIAISSAILFLAMHPEYQEKAYQEQIEVMKDDLGAPSRDELDRMNYLGMAYNETLRHVSVPAVARTISEQFTIDGYIFPAGASLYIMYHSLFHDPKYWERPNHFYPDHFLPEKVAARPKGAFLPFSFGSRSCPGKIFGKHSSKLILSMLLRRYKFTTKLKYEELVYQYMLMVETKNGYPVEVTDRAETNELS